MATWSALVDTFASIPDDTSRAAWLKNEFTGALQRVATLRGGRNVIFYGSAFLQKPQHGNATSITFEDINGLMAALHGMQWDAGLSLIVHTPGGATNAAETIVHYLRSKFEFEVIVPTFAMSAGTMISLAAQKVVMGHQSQLGPIDPQMHFAGNYVSAQAIVDQFTKAQQDISTNPASAHAWAPVLASLGPALLVEAENALKYGEHMVTEWLRTGMMASHADAAGKAATVAKYFNDAGSHKSHGRRIGKDEARSQGVVIDDLESDQALQDAVLTAYHLATIMFENSPCVKVIWNQMGNAYVKNIT